MNAIPWEQVEWVILDMDGTILDLAYDNYFWSELVPERYARREGISIAEARARLIPKFAAVAHTLPWYCTDYWSDVTGLSMAALTHEVRERILPLPGAVEFLDAVRSSGRKLWLATNAHRDSWLLKLEHTGLRERFDAVICSHDYGVPKEDRRFWEVLSKRNPFDPARTLIVDDALPVLSAARDFGLQHLVAIAYPDTTLPKRVIGDFSSVDRLADLLPII